MSAGASVGLTGNIQAFLTSWFPDWSQREADLRALRVTANHGGAVLFLALAMLAASLVPTSITLECFGS